MSDAAERAAKLAEKKLAPSIELADASPPWLSDDALAQKFAERPQVAGRAHAPLS